MVLPQLGAQPEVSPHLYQFLLGQSAGPKKKTTAGLRPGAVKQGLFASHTNQNVGALSHLQTLASGRSATRANSDTMYTIGIQKKQQAAAELLYKKQQEALAKKLKEIAAKSQQQQQVTPRPNLPLPGPGNGQITLPPVPAPGRGSDGSILPPIVAPKDNPQVAEINQRKCDMFGICAPGYYPKTQKSYPNTSISAPKKEESLLDKLKGLFS